DPEPKTGGLKPYVHMRRDLWAKVTRALFYDLVELGEERDVAGARMFGVVSSGEFFAMAPAAQIRGLLLMGGAASQNRWLRAKDFCDREGEGLTLDGPVGLSDPNVTPARGDHDADPVMRAIAAVRPIRPAAVLVPIVDRPEPTVLLTQRTTELSSHAGQIAFP